MTPQERAELNVCPITEARGSAVVRRCIRAKFHGGPHDFGDDRPEVVHAATRALLREHRQRMSSGDFYEDRGEYDAAVHAWKAAGFPNT